MPRWANLEWIELRLRRWRHLQPHLLRPDPNQLRQRKLCLERTNLCRRPVLGWQCLCLSFRNRLLERMLHRGADLQSRRLQHPATAADLPGRADTAGRLLRLHDWRYLRSSLLHRRKSGLLLFR